MANVAVQKDSMTASARSWTHYLPIFLAVTSKMRIGRIVSLTSLAAGTTAQAGVDGFEPLNFNVTAALEDLGVPVETLPEPSFNSSRIAQRSLIAPCSLAVSRFFYETLDYTRATAGAVRLIETPLWQ